MAELSQYRKSIKTSSSKRWRYCANWGYKRGSLHLNGLCHLSLSKKDRTVRFLSNFWEVNKRLVRKPFPIPKISTVLQELEGFTFATALDLNMGYYTIRLDPDASKKLHHHISVGKVFLQAITNGHCRFPSHFPRKDVGADGILGICTSLS
jgi:hypothetical protein